IFGTLFAGKISEKKAPEQVLKYVILAMLVGVALLLTSNIYLFIAGLGILTFFFFSAHTTASKMVAMHAQKGKSAATSTYWLFYYLGSSVLGSGTGYLLHATSWNSYILFLITAVFISLTLTTMHKKTVKSKRWRLKKHHYTQQLITRLHK